MVFARVLAAALAQKAARSQRATAKDASRAAALATLFANPVAGLVIARAMTKPAKPSDDTDGEQRAMTETATAPAARSAARRTS
jgi:hypothetical protein